jgi:hypothetical protein
LSVDMMPSVDTILDSAWRSASQRASTDDMAVAVVTALRRLHQVIDETAGGTAAATFLASVHQVVLEANLRKLRITRQPPVPKPLPAPLPSARVACAILEDAANGCLALNCAAEDNTPLCEATERLVERLVDLLGGAPDQGALVDRVAAGRPFVTLTVPTDCACPIN